jgi:hypothetical protein
MRTLCEVQSSQLDSTFSDNPSHASTADEFDPLSNLGFFATFRRSPNGANPGRLAEFDSCQHFVQARSMNPRNDGFGPHRLAIDEAHNLVVTSDFICQLRSLNVVGGDEVNFARYRPCLEFQNSLDCEEDRRMSPRAPPLPPPTLPEP